VPDIRSKSAKDVFLKLLKRNSAWTDVPRY
jgi:hypothetical protein